MPDNVTKDWIQTATDETAVSQGCYFDLAAAERVRKFFRRFCVHSKGQFEGQSFELLDWQWKRLIGPAFGWKMPDGTRRIRSVDCFLPKKNGKSTMMAGVSLYLLLGDKEPGAEVYSCAADRNQAAIVYNEAEAMVKASDQLKMYLKIRKSVKTIHFPDKSGVYKVISADGFRNEGYNIHGLVFDEIHTQKNRALWDALKYGFAARRQGIRFVISTAGEYDETLLWWERFQYARKLQENVERDDIHTLGIAYYADSEKDDWHDEATWRKANPSYGITINPREFRKAYDEACINGANESSFKRYHLNWPTKHESAWLLNHYWTDVSNRKPGSLQPQKGVKLKSWGGIDLADNIDLNAFACIAERKHKEKGDCLSLHVKLWAPEEAGLTHNRMNRERYMQWWEKGHLLRTPGAVANQDQIEDEIVQFLLENDFDMQEIGVDRYQGTRCAYSLRDKLRAKAIKTSIRLCPYNYHSCNEPTRLLEGLIVSGKLLVEPNPVLDWMFGNVQVTQDRSGNRMLDKAFSKNKIDAFAATIIALFCMVNMEPGTKSKYNDPNNKPQSVDIWQANGQNVSAGSSVKSVKPLSER